MILEHIDTEFRETTHSADSSKYHLTLKNPQTYILICTHLIIDFISLCVCVPAPKKHVLFSSSRNWLCLSANNWGEDVCTVLGFLFGHLFVNHFDPCCPKKNIQVIVLDM